MHGWSALIRTVGQLSGFTDWPVDRPKYYTVNTRTTSCSGDFFDACPTGHHKDETDLPGGI